jgi:hypothetical protein
VNTSSLLCLAELYPNDDGQPDEDGTGICSKYASHTMYWDKAQFNKTFQTALSGLPECLFSSGYLKFEAFSTMIANVYDDAISKTFALKGKIHPLAQLDDGDFIVNDGGPIVYADDNGIMMDVSLALTNLISFFDGISLQYNDGIGTRDVMTFIGADFVDDMQMKCKVKLSNDRVFFVDPETLNFIENPDIALIPQTFEDYNQESKNISPLQLQNLLSQKSLSPLQEEMLSHHNWLQYMPFPKLIIMAQQGKIPKMIGIVKGTMSTVCGLPFWSGSQMSMAIQIQTKVS